MTLYRLACPDCAWTGYRNADAHKSPHKSGAARCPECKSDRVHAEPVTPGAIVETVTPNGTRVGWDWIKETWVAA
jgi:Zn finger protein HypA/HybF involved in hydrogenase expression